MALPTTLIPLLPLLLPLLLLLDLPSSTSVSVDPRPPHSLAAQQFLHATHDRLRFRADPTLCLDLTAGSLAKGNKIQLWPCDDPTSPASQRWTFYGDGAAANASSSQALRYASNLDWCVDLPGGLTNNGEQVTIWQCPFPPNSNQAWVLRGEQISSGLNHSKCLEVVGGLPAAPGRQIELWDCATS